MAIEYCHRHETQWDRDKHTECPWCARIAHLMSLPGVPQSAATMQRVEITERGASDLIRRLMDGYPFQAKDKELHDECKRVLREA